ncbi:MAG: hypothetical protein J6X31_10575 [Bacteroidales bacterium]|nr:hypothetical protein [Bacteroidales bacterium]
MAQLAKEVEKVKEDKEVKGDKDNRLIEPPKVLRTRMTFGVEVIYRL